jgi:EAL domain-containing protein (putative c-di-GMP-specific phosphodiesterase class I)
MIEPITAWVLDESLRQCRIWLDEVGTSRVNASSVAVNLSARSLLDSSLPDEVELALTKWNLPPGLLVLEITETMIMSDPHRAHHVLNELAGMGVILSIDDFGTGYSSLAYLRDLPVHELKIDRSFVHDMVRNTHNAAIVRLVVDLAHNLGLQTIAEGVEDETTWQALHALGCDNAQGYHLARPMPADQISSWTSEYLRETAKMLTGCRVHGSGCGCSIDSAGIELQTEAVTSEVTRDHYGPEAPTFPCAVGPSDGALDPSASHTVVGSAGESST